MTLGLRRTFQAATVAVAAILCLAAPQLSASTIVFIDFDSHPAYVCPCSQGTLIPATDLVTDDYLSSGVDFNSPVAILAGSNPVTAPNVAAGTTNGGIDYFADVFATFSYDVDFVSITLTNSSGSATLQAFDNHGTLLSSATGGPGTITVSDAGLIHSVEILPLNAAFDDFTFGISTPEPSTILLLGPALAAVIAARLRLRKKRSVAPPSIG